MTESYGSKIVLFALKMTKNRRFTNYIAAGNQFIGNAVFAEFGSVYPLAGRRRCPACTVEGCYS